MEDDLFGVTNLTAFGVLIAFQLSGLGENFWLHKASVN